MRELRILLVEDEQDAAEIISFLLRHDQLTADHVASAEAAYEALLNEHYDAVISDLFLPGIDGLELMRYIRRQPRLAALPCIAITAYNSSEVKQQAYAVGFNRYFPKPVDPTELLQGLRALLAE